MQALAVLFGAAFTVAVCIASGRLLLRRTLRDPAAEFVVGAAAVSLAVFALCASGAVYAWVFLLLGAASLWMAWRLPAAAPVAVKRFRGAVRYALAGLFLLYLVVYFWHAMAPEASPDGAAYHLALVGRYWREHGFHRITTSIYASLSQGVEMIFLVAFAFGRHSAAALVHLAFLLALAWQMFRYGSGAGYPMEAACAAFLVFASPLVGIDAASAYNDVAVAAIAFTVFHLLQIWDARRDPRLLLPIGLVAGFAYATKYTAALAIPYALGYVAWKSRRSRDVALVAGGAALLVLPWMLKNWLWVQNPFSPFFNQWFLNPYVTVSFEKEYSSYLRHYDIALYSQIPLQVTTYGRLSGVLGPVFLLAPLGLLASFRREGRQLLVAALVFGAPYFGNIGARFLIPPLPFVALALALVVGRLGVPALGALVALHAVLSWPSIVPKYAREDAWRLRGIPWREALRLRPEDRYLEDRLPGYGMVRLIESQTAPGATVFTIQPLPAAYTSRRILVDYESAGNQVLGRTLRTGAVPEYAPVQRLAFSFPRQALRGVRVTQTNTGNDRWTIHELRIFDGGRELPREPAWRLRARPFPWGIQDAFDNSAVTFWISGETLHPGMFVEADFGAERQADAVRIETSPNQWQARLRLEGQTASGEWKALAAAPRISEEARPLGLRSAVAAELKGRGVDYLVLFDSDLGADDLKRNAGRWGIRQVGQYKDARLYELP